LIYRVSDTLTDSSENLTLEWKLAVDESLAFKIGMLFMPFWHVLLLTVDMIFMFVLKNFGLFTTSIYVIKWLHL